MKQALKIGLIGGVVEILLSLIGMVEAFSQRDIIAHVISMGHTLLVIVALFMGYLAAKRTPQTGSLQVLANFFLKDISGPIQLHHGTADTSVPVEFSQTLEKQMKEAGKTVELYTYPGDDHNMASNFSVASQRSVEFFDKHLK